LTGRLIGVADNGPEEHALTASKVPDIQHWKSQMVLMETASGLKQLHTSPQTIKPCGAFQVGCYTACKQYIQGVIITRVHSSCICNQLYNMLQSARMHFDSDNCHVQRNIMTVTQKKHHDSFTCRAHPGALHTICPANCPLHLLQSQWTLKPRQLTQAQQLATQMRLLRAVLACHSCQSLQKLSTQHSRWAQLR